MGWTQFYSELDIFQMITHWIPTEFDFDSLCSTVVSQTDSHKSKGR